MRDSVVLRLIRIIINTDPVLRSSAHILFERRVGNKKNINIKCVNRFKPHRDNTSCHRIHGKKFRVKSRTVLRYSDCIICLLRRRHRHRRMRRRK